MQPSGKQAKTRQNTQNRSIRTILSCNRPFLPHVHGKTFCSNKYTTLRLFNQPKGKAFAAI